MSLDVGPCAWNILRHSHQVWTATSSACADRIRKEVRMRATWLAALTIVSACHGAFSPEGGDPLDASRPPSPGPDATAGAPDAAPAPPDATPGAPDATPPPPPPPPDAA